jgi:nitrate reductase gamma subunit
MIADFIEGPLWYFSSIVFLVAVIWRLIAIVARGKKKNLAKPRASKGGGAIATIFRRFKPYPEFFHASRLRIFAGYSFHLGLFALLFFAVPHIEFIQSKTGLSWPAMPHWAFIVASELAFFGLLFLWLFRVMNPVTRMLSTRGDHIGSILVFIVMLTGCLAILRSHEVLRLTHLFTAELLLLYFPFSSLMHAFTFPFSRGFTGAVYNRRGLNI